MKKKFNITGVCYPHLHYMMDNSQKIREVMDMVEDAGYLVIFDGRKQKGWKQERISHQGKEIFAIWV